MIRALVLSLAVAAPAFAFADGPPVDADWPCQQRKQPHLSLAQVWSGPMPNEATLALAKSPDVAGLAEVLALRRTPMDEAEAKVRAFADSRADDPEAITALYAATFDHVNATRDRVMEGITRYARKQEAMETRIEDLRHQMTALEAADPKDFDRMDAVEKDLDWATRVFQDRQQSLTYVCETPVILEQRAFALGRVAQALLPQ